MKGNGLVVGVIVVAAGLGFALGLDATTFHAVRLTWLSTWLSADRESPHQRAISSETIVDAREKW